MIGLKDDFLFLLDWIQFNQYFNIQVKKLLKLKIDIFVKADFFMTFRITKFEERQVN